jgi:hypothetical protein
MKSPELRPAEAALTEARKFHSTLPQPTAFFGLSVLASPAAKQVDKTTA